VSPQEQPQDQQRSLYRRHRPRTFAEVVGQEPVVRTLSNAVERGQVHHAYLFVGSRGTGKTSMAKILAACLNCARGGGAPTVDPCGECESCVSIARATSLDVIEMDAASNNSVEDIRELRESVAYAPVSGGRKVYILDEAHMLSTAAWNAFLKTLEEPPPNTVFVLATTEAAKVPATVVDRCHRFDFQRPTVEQIAVVIRRAADAESIEIPPPAVAALARAATGSFRDALGTLEQLVTYSGRQVALEDVLAVLGIADAGLLEATVDAVAAGDSRAALQAVERSSEQGRDAASLAADLEVRARELLVVGALGEVPAELSLTPESDAALLAQAERVDHATVVRLLELLGAAMEAVRAGADPRTRLELALVKAARPETEDSMRGLLARVQRLEQGLPDRPASPVPSAPDPAPAGAEPPAVQARERPATPAGGDGPQSSGRAATVVADPPAAPDPSAAPAEEVSAAPPQEGSTTPDELETVRSLWPAVVELVRGENALLGALIAEARPVAAHGEDLTLAFASTAPFLKKKAEDPANRMTVGEALRAVTGRRWRLSYELREEVQQNSRAGGPSEGGEEDWVRRLIDEFNAEELPEGWEPGGEVSAGRGGARAAAGGDGEEHGVRAVSSNEKGA
jgi:DNA polymerase-3 subunit gamma/tau